MVLKCGKDLVLILFPKETEHYLEPDRLLVLSFCRIIKKKKKKGLHFCLPVLSIFKRVFSFGFAGGNIEC